MSSFSDGRYAQLAALLFILLALGAPSAAATTPAGLTPHGRISILGDDGFTSTNGVTAGNGTPANPYIIEGWEIDASFGMGIEIVGTTAYFVIRNVYVHTADRAVRLYGVDHAQVQNSTATGSWYGIWVDSSRDVKVVGNNVSRNNGAGISIVSSTGVDALANTIAYNDYGPYIGAGIFVEASTNATVASNTFTHDGIFVRGTDPSHYASHEITRDNLVNGRPVYYYRNCNDLSVDGVAAGQVIIAGCSNVRVSNLTVDQTEVGVELAYVDGGSVTGSVLTDDWAGLYVTDSRNISVEANYASDSQYNMAFYSSTGVSVIGNNISRTRLQGVTFGFTTGSRAVHNVFWEASLWLAHAKGIFVGANVGRGGVTAQASTDSLIMGNDFSGGGYGTLVDESTNITVAENVYSNSLYAGVELIYSGGNHVYHNNLINNTVQAIQYQGSGNLWDAGYPGGGNFWSDYTGGDSCSGPSQDQCPPADGIGDTPYTIQTQGSGFGIVDRYPLMQPFNSQPRPVASFTFTPASPLVGQPVAFDASTSTGTITSYAWDFGDGSATIGQRVNHAYGAAGTYIVTLKVVDSAGLDASYARQVTVYRTLPAGTALVDLGRRGAWSSDRRVSLSSPATPVLLHATLINRGTVAAGGAARFVVMDGAGRVVATVESKGIRLEGGAVGTVDVSWSPSAVGHYTITAVATYDSDGNGSLDSLGPTSKAFTVDVI